MSRYTTELHYIVESGFDLGLKDYPVISEDYRTALNKKILDHYWFHEIGFETAARFKHYLNVKMNEIMPYYDQMLQSELLTVNPLLSFSRSHTSSRVVEGENEQEVVSAGTIAQTQANTSTLDSTTTANTKDDTTTLSEGGQTNTVVSTRANDIAGSGSSKTVSSDTPSGLLSMANIEANVYATNAVIASTTSTSEEDETLNSTDTMSKNDSGESHVVGLATTVVDSGSTSNTTNNSTESKTDNLTATKNETETTTVTESGTEIPFSDLLMKYRETFLNVDVLIIGELADLFMQIY